MNIGEFNTQIAASASGTLMAEKVSRSTEEQSQRSVVLDRLQESRERAQKTEGVGTLENETQHSSGNSGGDGRLYRFWNPLNDTASSKKYRDRSFDPSGKIGKNIDIIG
ncbi:MAG: hypothetical protein Q4C95_00305 [Planctomycetia bacterium]|nr:hypothetical protein [Planctomycetia bacterium]